MSARSGDMTPAPTFEYFASGRTRRTLTVVIAVWTGLIAAWLFLDAAWWIIAGLALTTLPAIWDLYTDRQAGLRLGPEGLEWWSGRGSAEMPLNEIDHIRFDTRLDFTVRVSAVTLNQRRIRLPYDALPHHKILEAACQVQGLRTQRHHFSLL